MHSMSTVHTVTLCIIDRSGKFDIWNKPTRTDRAVGRTVAVGQCITPETLYDCCGLVVMGLILMRLSAFSHCLPTHGRYLEWELTVFF